MINNNNTILNALVDYIHWVYYNDFYLDRRFINRNNMHTNLNATRLANTLFIIHYNFLVNYNKEITDSIFHITPYGIIPRDIYFIHLKLGSYNYNNIIGKRTNKQSLQLVKLLNEEDIDYIYDILFHLKDIKLFDLIKMVLKNVEDKKKNNINAVYISNDDIKTMDISNLNFQPKKQTN